MRTRNVPLGGEWLTPFIVIAPGIIHIADYDRQYMKPWVTHRLGAYNIRGLCAGTRITHHGWIDEAGHWYVYPTNIILLAPTGDRFSIHVEGIVWASTP